MDKKISVIIPIYKVENYLNRCIESVVRQSYQNLEIILINDGSPDNCPKLCDEWKEKDSRILVVHKENGGLSDARNAGMAIMTGEYVFFIDSDDWIHKDTLKTLVQIQKKYDADIVECKALPTDKEVQDKGLDFEEIEITEFETKSAMAALLRENPLKQTVWNKLYKRNMVEGIEFAVAKYHEDEFWTYQVFDRAKKILFINLNLYYYFQRSDSIMGQAFSMKRVDAIEGRYNRLKLIKEKYPELLTEAKENLAFLIIYYGQQALKTLNNENRNYFSSVEKYINGLAISRVDARDYAFTHKLWIEGSSKNLKLVCKLRNLMKIGID